MNRKQFGDIPLLEEYLFDSTILISSTNSLPPAVASDSEVGKIRLQPVLAQPSSVPKRAPASSCRCVWNIYQSRVLCEKSIFYTYDSPFLLCNHRIHKVPYDSYKNKHCLKFLVPFFDVTLCLKSHWSVNTYIQTILHTLLDNLVFFTLSFHMFNSEFDFKMCT